MVTWAPMNFMWRGDLITSRSMTAGADPLLKTASNPIVSAPPCRTGWLILMVFSGLTPSGPSGRPDPQPETTAAAIRASSPRAGTRLARSGIAVRLNNGSSGVRRECVCAARPVHVRSIGEVICDLGVSIVARLRGGLEADISHGKAQGLTPGSGLFIAALPLTVRTGDESRTDPVRRPRRVRLCDQFLAADPAVLPHMPVIFLLAA